MDNDSIVIDDDEDYSASACVARGVKLLDAQRPGWRDRIDVTTLNMASSWDCVLGQLHGPIDEDEDEKSPYVREREALGLMSGEWHGFCSSPVSDFFDLQTEWERVLSN